MSGCPVCGNRTGYATNSMETYLCANCGALFNSTPFGVELVTTDARDRFPEYNRVYPVKAWKNLIERGDDDGLDKKG